jgi:hypothetical protein
MIHAASTQWVEKTFVKGSDSVSMQAVIARAKDPEATWGRSYLWNGAVPTHGISAISLVGSPGDCMRGHGIQGDWRLAVYLLGLAQNRRVDPFGEEVLPLIREREAHQ